MNDEKRKTSYVPWILFGVVLLGLFGFAFLLIVGLVAGIVSSGGDDFYPTKGNVAVVEVSGVIRSSKKTVSSLKKLKNDSTVKAVVLRVDSPGGAVAPSQEIHDMVAELAAKKVIVVSMGSVAASGGYYISAPARKIVANPGTVTGSIGVLLELFVAEDLIRKLYLDWTVIKSGDTKDMGSPLRRLSQKEIKILQDIAYNIHEQFKSAVSKGRKLSEAEIAKISDGRILTGEQALKLKLIDELGGLERAASIAAGLAGIPGEPKIYYPYQERKKFWKNIVEDVSMSVYDKISENGFSAKPLLLMPR